MGELYAKRNLSLKLVHSLFHWSRARWQLKRATYFSGCVNLGVPAIGPQLLTQLVYSLRTCAASFLGVCFSEVLS